MKFQSNLSVNRTACNLPSYPAGELFAQAPVKEYPGVAVETVSDSSRYFVLRIQDDNGEEVDVAADGLRSRPSNHFIPPVRRSQRFHRRWLRRQRGRLRFQRDFAGPFQVSTLPFYQQNYWFVPFISLW